MPPKGLLGVGQGYGGVGLSGILLLQDLALTRALLGPRAPFDTLAIYV